MQACCSFCSTGLWNSTLGRWEMKLNSLLTAALCLSPHFSKTAFPWCSGGRGAAKHHTSLTLSEAQKHQFILNVLFHRENKLGRQWHRNTVLEFPSNRPARNTEGTSQLKATKNPTTGCTSSLTAPQPTASSYFQQDDTKLLFWNFLFLQHLLSSNRTESSNNKTPSPSSCNFR